MIIGIDPGWASCGYALTYYKQGLQASGHFVPRDESKDGTLASPIEHMVNSIDRTIMGTGDIDFRCVGVSGVYIERYVAYKGIHSDMSEQILMFIGAVRHYFEFNGVNVHMVRAIDWKPEVCKYLVRTKGFSNPSPSFDKKFSIAAATALSGREFKTDHEADAVCLSYLGEIDKYNKERTKK